MKVIISGMAAVGKSTLARVLAKRYNLKLCSPGDLLKGMAREQGYNPVGDGWWESEEGLDFLKKRKSDPRFDRELDRRIKEILDSENVVVTAWTMPWIYNNDECIRIWLKAPEEIRARRMMKRDRISFDQALRIVKERDVNNMELFLRFYNIQLGIDLSPFDIVLDTRKLSAKDVESIVLTILEKLKKESSR
jgi:cytidylate kinase